MYGIFIYPLVLYVRVFILSACKTSKIRLLQGDGKLVDEMFNSSIL